MAEDKGTPVAVSLHADVKKEVTQQTAKWLVGGIVALIAAALAGWLALLKPWLGELAGGVPSGAVVAFDSPKGCPSGWSLFEDAAGRVILGDGQGKGLQERPYRQMAGAETHQLTVDQLPSHSHEVQEMVHNDQDDGVDSATKGSYEHKNHTRRTGNTGGNQPHNIMQPYIALKYCKKN